MSLSPRVRLLAFSVLTMFLLAACNTTEPEPGTGPGEGSGDVARTMSYEDTTWTQLSGISCSDDTESVLTFTFGRDADEAGRVLYLHVGANPLANGPYVVTGGIDNDSAGVAGLTLYDLGLNFVHAAESAGSVTVTRFAGGDSVRVKGDSVLMTGGKPVTFDLVALRFCAA